MRGKVARAFQLLDDLRITPAHAGKRTFPFNADESREDHPRPCGEKHGRRGVSDDTHGSPPPMRGKADDGLAEAEKGWITPAHAGKSFSGNSGAAGCEDHPRPCGEKFVSAIAAFMASGSPPPMRGKGHDTIGVQAGKRITPAHAGKRHAELNQ